MLWVGAIPHEELPKGTGYDHTLLPREIQGNKTPKLLAKNGAAT